MLRSPLFDVPKYLKIYHNYLGLRIYLMFILTLMAGLFEGVGLIMILPLIDGVVNLNYAAQKNIIAEYLYQTLAIVNLQDSIFAILLIILIAFMLKGLLTFAALALNAYFRGKLMRELKVKLFDAYENMTYSYFSSRDTGHFINLINEQTTRALQAFFQITQLCSQFIQAIIYLVLALLVAWKFGVFAVIVAAFFFIFFSRINHSVRDYSRGMSVESGRLAKILIQTLHGFKYISATGQTSKIKKQIELSIKFLTDCQMRMGIAAAFTHSIREPIAAICVVLIIAIQVLYFEESVGPILVSILLFYRAFNASLAIQSYLQSSLEAIGSMELVHCEFKNQKSHQEKDGKKIIPRLSSEIELRNISYTHGAELPYVFKGLNLKISACTTVALVGQSGAGKSTLLDLITLILRPQSGQILIDGCLSDEVDLKSWRRQIGFVSQEMVIFDDTIANNISMWSGAVADNQSLVDRIKNAATQACLTEFIDSLPLGYETIVGDRGIRLSGGQRQRLFIARELFRSPNLLILDEATSALDSESELAIQNSICELRGKATIIIIAHRLSTVRTADQILVFHGGEIVESGSYNELRNSSSSRFSKLVEMQSL
jgi:ABC-type multidrug transport system fused ATPase/permease subunit